MSLQELIVRLEKATGPDRALDGDIAVACSYATGFLERHGKREDGWVSKGEHHAVVPAPAYTASIDAALTLVTERWSYRVGANEPRTNAQAVLARSYPTNKIIEQEAANPAIALCIASLRARQST